MRQVCGSTCSKDVYAADHSFDTEVRASRLLLKPEEAAEVLGIGRSTLYELLAAGHIESVQIGRSRRIPMAALDEYVQRLRSDQRQQP